MGRLLICTNVYSHQAGPWGLSSMEPTTKRLRPYQVRLVTDVCRATEDVLVEQPTGSGKTVQIVTLVAMQLGRRYSHAVISAPQTQIEQGFTRRDYDTVAFPESQGVAVPSIQVPNQSPQSLIKGARDSGLGSVKRVIQYLRQPGPLDHAFACTHAALNRLPAEELPEDLSGKPLFIDAPRPSVRQQSSTILWNLACGLCIIQVRNSAATNTTHCRLKLFCGEIIP
jgi:hypothetical protein